MSAPFPPSDFRKLIPNPNTQSPCQEVVQGVFVARQYINRFYQWMFKEDPKTGIISLGDDFVAMLRQEVPECLLPCPTTPTTTMATTPATGSTLNGLRWQLPCVSPVTGDPQHCHCADASEDVTATLDGSPLVVYNVELRFRGKIEGKTMTGGVLIGGFCYLGGAPHSDGFNFYTMVVTDSDGTRTYCVNANGPNLFFPTDYTVTIPMRGGALVTLSAISVDGIELRSNLVVPGVPPAPASYDGQFLQMDVVSVT